MNEHVCDSDNKIRCKNKDEPLLTCIDPPNYYQNIGNENVIDIFGYK